MQGRGSRLVFHDWALPQGLLTIREWVRQLQQERPSVTVSVTYLSAESGVIGVNQWPVFLKTMSQGPDILSNAAIFMSTAFWSLQLSVVVLTVPVRRKKTNITLFALNQLKPSSQIYNWEFSIGHRRGLIHATGSIESCYVDSIKSPRRILGKSSFFILRYSVFYTTLAVRVQ